MNILILNWRDVRHPKSGGAEAVTWGHAKGWAVRGHKVVWLTSSYQGAKQQETIDGVEILRIGGSLTIYLVAPLYLLLKSASFDVIVDEVHGIPFFSPLFTRRPLVVFIHEIAAEIWDYMYSFPINFIGKKLEAFYFYLYRHKFFWTDAPSTIEELVARGIPRSACIAIPCAIGVGVRSNYPKNSYPTYVFLSRVVRMKGIEEVIKAFAFIHSVQKIAVLWIIGGGEQEYLAKLKVMVEEYNLTNFVTFWGKVEDDKKYELLSKASILLHASVKEGWGLVVLEAAALGTPTVAYNVAGLRDVVFHGRTGVVLQTNSPKELAEEAVRLYKEKKRYQEYQKAGVAWVRSITWENAINRSLSVLTKAAHTH